MSREFCTGTPWELLHADDLVIIAETEDELRMKLIKWKTNLEAKVLRVNIRKTKIMISRVDLQTLKDSGKYPCSVCRKGVGSTSIYCTGCLNWVHKICSGVIGKLKQNPDYRCNRCKGTARTIDGRPYNEWLFEQDIKLDVVDSFCYLGDTMGAGGGCYHKSLICVGQVLGTLANINFTCSFVYHTWANTVFPLISVGPQMSATL